MNRYEWKGIVVATVSFVCLVLFFLLNITSLESTAMHSCWISSLFFYFKQHRKCIRKRPSILYFGVKRFTLNAKK